MSGFGGAVKLTGESEYKKALSQITQSLREVASEMNVVSSSFNSNDKSVEALSAKEEVLNKKLEEQTNKLNVLKAQYSSMSSQYSESTQKHEALVNTYNEEKEKLDAIGKELGTTSKEYQEQEKKVADLEKEVIQSTKAQDDNEKSMSKMRQQINNAQADCNKTAKEIDNLGKETEEAGKDAKDASEGFTVFKGVLANLASSAIKTAIDGMKKLASALVDVGKQAYSSYAEYEQLVGGVETLFGDSANVVQEYAQNAYKTAGLSANEYMSTVTSFSASLLQGLNGDTAKSAEIANLAITDMSDNANKMGTSMESIQTAYQGFAKQNYTMLDNLKLGYGGTKTEMLRLVKDAGVVEEAVSSLDDVSFDQIIEGIHVIQTQMGITGTTAKEASTTIEGSTQSVKASWQNLLVAIADGNADLGGAVRTFSDSVMTMLSNAIPRIKQIVSGMWNALKQMLKQNMPEFANSVLPVIEKIYNGIKNIVTFISKNFKTIVPIVLSLVTAFTSLNASLAISGTISAVTTALSGLTAGVGLATKAQVVWNAVMEANPIGAVIGAVTALIAVIVLLSQVETEHQKERKETIEAYKSENELIQEQIDSYNQLKDAKQEELSAGMSEMTHYENLYKELQSITDENGKVKKGYEERASFLTNELSNALGIEINLVDGVVQEYQTLRGEIDKVIEKKKAQIILDSQESLYKEAITKQGEAIIEYNKLQDEYIQKQKEAKDTNQAYYDALRELSDASTEAEVMNAKIRVDQLYQEKQEKEQDLAWAQYNYEQQEGLLEEYAYNIAQYENNMQLAHEERYGEMTTTTWDYVDQYSEADDKERAILEDKVRNERSQIEVLRNLQKKYGGDTYDEQIRQAQRRLEENQKALDEYNKQTQEATDDAEIIWKRGLDKQLSDLTGSQIEFKSAGDGQVQMYVDGIATGETKSPEEMAKIVDDTIKEISNRETDSESAGTDLIWGVNNGVANQVAQNSVFASIANFGQSLLAQLRWSLAEQSPSKETKKMGAYLLEGLGIGIESEEQDTIRQVASVGHHIMDALDSELSEGANIDLKMSGSAHTSRYDYMVSAFKQALSEMKIELDGEVAGEFVDRTVTQLIYG